MLPDALSDPFGERCSMQFSKRMHLLGGQFCFDSNNRQLMQLVESAYAGLPRHRLSDHVPQFRVRLLSTPSAQPRNRSEPQPLALLAGGGLLGGASGQSDFVVLSPSGQGAVVVASPRMLRYAYHTRYDLIEFAVFTLAARHQGLVALHAACVGRRGDGILLMGESGSGKSTLALHALLRGLDFLSEDSVFVAPQTLQATGVANFLHLRPASLRWLKGMSQDATVRQSPVIRRRSGVRKYEVDLRNAGYKLAPAPLRIRHVVFVSDRSATGGPALLPLRVPVLRERLRTEQGYAAKQPSWQLFEQRVMELDAFELRRTDHPNEAVDRLAELLPSA